jgi:hypothetical protein
MLVPKLLLVFILSMVLFAVATPDARAQTTSIVNFQAPFHALAGRDITITLSASYNTNNAYNAYAFIAGIEDATLAPGYYVTGTAYSSSNICASRAETFHPNSASCGYVLTSTSGSDTITFHLTLSSQQDYHLYVSTWLVDRSGNILQSSVSQQMFTISVSDKLRLMLATKPYSATMRVLVDGISQIGIVDVSVGSHTISVPTSVPGNNNTQLRFDHWSDGSNDTTRVLNLQNDTTLTAFYLTQYRLSLSTQVNTSSGGGWYDSGSIATFSVPSRFLFWEFQGWYENGALVTASNNGSIRMDAPHVLTASWALNYILIVIICIIIAVVGALYYKKRSGTSTKTKKLTEHTLFSRVQAQTAVNPSEEKTTQLSQTETKTKTFCNQCGVQIPRKSKFCKECGAMITD